MSEVAVAPRPVHPVSRALCAVLATAAGVAIGADLLAVARDAGERDFTKLFWLPAALYGAYLFAVVALQGRLPAAFNRASARAG